MIASPSLATSMTRSFASSRRDCGVSDASTLERKSPGVVPHVGDPQRRGNQVADACCVGYFESSDVWPQRDLSLSRLTPALTGRRRAKRGGYPQAQLAGGPVERGVSHCPRV